MAKRKATRGGQTAKTRRKTARSGAAKRTSGRKTSAKGGRTAAKAAKASTRRSVKRTGARKAGSARKTSRARNQARPEDLVPTPPSSLNMNRRGSAARTGRAEIAESRSEHATMTPAITGGDVDADVERAYFSGEEAPGGDNPTPDQDIVDDIGRALGVEYQDNEELRASDKVTARDRKRWELDPASAEDYKERQK